MSNSSRSLSEILNLSREAANRTRSDEPASPCVSCKRSLVILPLRYGVVSGQDRSLVERLAPALPAHLGKKLTIPLTYGRYAVRSLREGYLYVLIKRMGRKYSCESAYRVHDTGLLQPILPYEPGLSVSGVAALGGWTLTVGDPEDVDEARLLFTPDPLSRDMLDRYLEVNLDRESLQKFDLRTLANSCGIFPDAVTPSQVESVVAEFRAGDDAAAKALLEKQAFPPFRSAIAPGDSPRDMDTVYRNALDSLMEGRGVAVVLDDPIGIVQELNAWRNDSIEVMLPWLKTEDEHGISNERRYAVAEALDDVKNAMQLGYVEKAVEKAADKLRADRTQHLMNSRFGATLGTLDEQSAEYDPEQVRSRAESEKEFVFDKYEKMLDWKAKEQVQAEFARQDRLAQEEMDRRADDHITWLESEMLERAFDVYDSNDPVWGHAFAGQVALCVLGMNASSKGAAKLASWWSDTDISKGNLAWRALTRNNAGIARETRAAFAAAKGKANDLTADNLAAELESASGWFQKVADLLGKADAAVQMAVVGQAHRWFDLRRNPLELSLFASLNQYLLRLLPANAVDRWLLGPMLGFIHAGLGEVTTRLRLRELALAGVTANPNRVSGQVNAHIGRWRETVMQEFRSGGKGDFYQLRGGVLLALLEGITLGVKASKKDEGDKEYLEYQAAFLITTAAGIELAALGVDLVAKRFAPTTVVGRGAAVALGGLRLVGGSLAAVGGGMVAYIDLKDGNAAYEKKYNSLGFAYYARFAVSLGISGLSALVSISYSAPLLELILGRHAILVTLIETLGRQGVRSVLLRMIGAGTLVMVALSVAIILLAPEEMEEWCWHSCLKKIGSNDFFKPFKSQEVELSKLYDALKAVV